MTWLYVAVALFTLLSPFFLWVYYLAVMNLKRNKADLKGRVLYAGYVALAIGYGLDAYVNVLFMSVLLLERPRELTVTSRLKRHFRKDGTSWGKSVAIWSLPFLEPYDPGHITG